MGDAGGVTEERYAGCFTNMNFRTDRKNAVSEWNYRYGFLFYLMKNFDKASVAQSLCGIAFTLPALLLWLIGRGAVLIREHFQALHAQNHYAADEEEHNAERVQSHCRLRIFQRGRSHKDGVQGTQHHADDQIYRSPTVFGQGVLDQLDNADDAGNDTQPQRRSEWAACGNSGGAGHECR